MHTQTQLKTAHREVVASSLGATLSSYTDASTAVGHMWPRCVARTAAAEPCPGAQVNARANQLAHHLILQGASLGSAVGLLLAPSIDAVVAMLAVLKAGCAYLPLLQHANDAALALIAEDADLSTVLIHTEINCVSHCNIVTYKYICVSDEVCIMSEINIQMYISDSGDRPPRLPVPTA